MTTAKTSINKKYDRNQAYLRVKWIIQNPETLRQFPLDFECRIDTGFDGGILVPHWHLSDAKSIGVDPRPTNIVLADGRKIPAYVCVGHLQEIEGHALPLPGIPMILVMCGNRKGSLLGMDVLRNHVISFDGPAQAFSLTFC